jgi:ankyrin repeat protein
MTSEISSQIEKLKESFLLAAATGGRLLECQSLLELGAEIDYANDVDDKDTPLLAACRGGHRAVVSLLLVSPLISLSLYSYFPTKSCINLPSQLLVLYCSLTEPTPARETEKTTPCYTFVSVMKRWQVCLVQTHRIFALLLTRMAKQP